jgi:hypothetical protein
MGPAAAPRRPSTRAHPGVAVVEFGDRVSPRGRYTESVGGVQLRSDGLHLAPEGVERWIAPWLAPRVIAAVPREGR